MYKYPPQFIGYYSWKILLILTFFSFFSSSSGQSTFASNDSSRLKLYLDCDHCDFAYFRRNMDFVDYVRDPKTADLHLLVTDQMTGSNGISFGLNFIGREEYSDLNYKLTVFSPQSDTDVESWDHLIRTMKFGLMPYVSRTSVESLLSIEFENDSLKTGDEERLMDNWDYWVFRTNILSHIGMEESQMEFSSRASFRIDRITEKFKIRSDIMYFRRLATFEDGDESIESLREHVDSDIDLVYSLGPRWSLGYFNEFSSSTFENINFGFISGPAIEYNIFPWDQSDRRVFSLGYHINLLYADYAEPTIYQLTSELRMSESLQLEFIMRQAWGEIEIELEGSHYFHDFSKNRLSLSSEISLNITKGLQVFTAFETSLIHDQLNLAAGEVTREELLLQQRQLETSYSLFGAIGIQFTFGSIYNNIVNDRL